MRLARWSRRIAAAGIACWVASVGSVAFAYAVGVERWIEDAWLGYVASFVSALGSLAALVAFVMALVAKNLGPCKTCGHKEDLRLPLLFLPGLAVFVVLAEVLVPH